MMTRTVIFWLSLALCTLPACRLGGSAKSNPPTTPTSGGPTPIVTSVSPVAGPVSGGTVITITGSGFISGSLVYLGLSPCTAINVVSANSITCTTPAHTEGQVDLLVGNSVKQIGTLIGGYTYQVAPTLSSLSPVIGPAAGGTLVTIAGTGFISGASVLFDGIDCSSVNLASSTSLSCITPAHAAGVVTVVVGNNDGQSGSLSNAFVYRAAPTLTSLSTASGPIGGGTTVNLTGTGFLSGITVSFGGSDCSSVIFNSSSSVTCTTSAHVAGLVNVTVTNSDFQIGTLTNAFTYQGPPTVSSISPATGRPTGGTSVTLLGSGFLSGVTVSLGGSHCIPLTLNSASSITCTTSAHSTGTVNVVVSNPDAQSGTLSNGYLYDIPMATTSSIAIGDTHSCALLSNGTVKCWGKNGNGQLGQGNTNTLGDGANEMGDNLSLINLGTGRTATSIAAGGFHNCAILDNSSLKCWGRSNSGQLGQGNTNSLGDGPNEMGDNLGAVNLGIGRTASKIGAGQFHTCAILDNGSVKCWGRNSEGQLGQGHTNALGDGANEMGDNLLAINLGTGRTATKIAAGQLHSCAILDDGNVKCWGRNSEGELGQGHMNNLGDGANEMGDNLPSISLGVGRSALQISAGGFHTCAVLDNNSVKCWGGNGYGQLGQGNTNSIGDGANEMGDNLLAVSLGTGRRASSITSGQLHTCALLDSFDVKCWGYNLFGQLGQGSTTPLGDASNEMGNNLNPVGLGSALTATGIGAGQLHSCVLLNDQRVKCWGRNTDGQLGQAHTNNLGDGANEMGDNLSKIDLGTF